MRKYLNVCCYTVLIIIIGVMIRYIYMDNIKSLDDDLKNISTVFIGSYNFYERNKQSLSSEEMSQNLIQNEIQINNIVAKYYGKKYLPKYQLNLLQDIEELMRDILFSDTGSDSDRISFEILGEVGFALAEIEAPTGNYPKIDENGYNKIKNILLEHKKYIDSLPKTQNIQNENGEAKFFEKFSGKLGIILKDTKLQDPYVVTVDENGENVFQTIGGEVKLKQSDMAVCIAETEKGYVVEAVGGDLPRPRGFVDKDVLSFDEKQFIKANQGSIYQAMTYREIDGKELGESTAVVSIIKREGEWLQIEIPGMGAPVWIKSSSLEYKIEATGIDIKHTLGN